MVNRMFKSLSTIKSARAAVETYINIKPTEKIYDHNSYMWREQ